MPSKNNETIRILILNFGAFDLSENIIGHDAVGFRRANLYVFRS